MSVVRKVSTGEIQTEFCFFWKFKIFFTILSETPKSEMKSENYLKTIQKQFEFRPLPFLCSQVS